jgi:hypothetical protein
LAHKLAGGAIVLLAALAGGLGSAAGASAATELITHACPAPQIANVSALRAGYVSDGNSKYAADCGGAKLSAQGFVASKCSATSYLFRNDDGKVAPCYDTAYDRCLAYKNISTAQKLVIVLCQPTHNYNAVVTFDYHYSGTIPTVLTQPQGANNTAQYASCISKASAADSNSQIRACGRYLTPATCAHVLTIASGSISCREAMAIGDEADNYAIDTSQIEPFQYDGYQCYAGDQGTLCSRGKTQFTALV